MGNNRGNLLDWQRRENVTAPPEPRQSTVSQTTTDESSATAPVKSSNLQQAIDALNQTLQSSINTVTLPTAHFRAYTTIITGALVGEPTPIFTHSTPNRKAIISTPAGNSGTVYIGDIEVNATQYGEGLVPNSVSQTIAIGDLSKIYYYDTTSGDQFTISWEWGLGILTP